jgi:cyclase
MRKLFIAALLGLSTFALAQQQPNWEAVEIKVQKVAGNIYMLEGRGGNIGVSVGDDGILIVDDQYAPLAAKIQAALKGIADKPVRFVLNTHWHGDHTGGNEKFAEKSEIIAHENVRKRLEAGGKTRFGEVKPAAAKALPIITFNSRLTVYVNGEEIRAIHFPQGHTDGDSVIYFTKSNVVHMGDDFFSGNFPFIDLDSGGSVQGLMANVEKVLAELPDDVKIIPGHGPLSTKKELSAFLEMLRDTSSAVQNAIKQGKSLEEVKAAKLFTKYESWGKGFINPDLWAEIVYRSLTNPQTGQNPHNAHGHTYLGGGRD